MLAAAGLGSRREIERWIAEGRVAVDGRVAQLGESIEPTARVVVDGKPVRLRGVSGEHTHLAYYKPAGEVTTRDDPEGRPTVFDRLPAPSSGRWIAVGRLDLNTSGLLLLTTDGELAHRLMHPRYEVSREYAVRLLGAPGDADLAALKSGIRLDDGLARFDSVEQGGGAGANAWIHVALREGRNREVRRMFEAIGLTVSRLIRVRYGPVQLARMKRGLHRRLEPGEVRQLYAVVGLEPPAVSTPSSESKAPGRGKAPSSRVRAPGSRGKAPSSRGEAPSSRGKAPSRSKAQSRSKAPSRGKASGRSDAPNRGDAPVGAAKVTRGRARAPGEARSPGEERAPGTARSPGKARAPGKAGPSGPGKASRASKPAGRRTTGGPLKLASRSAGRSPPSSRGRAGRGKG